MVVRHEGDLQTSVANSPSDGRERAIADGLLVVNASPPGPPARLILKAPASSVLVGSTLPIGVHAVDAFDQPLALAQTDCSFSAAPATRATIDGGGLLHASAVGDIQVGASCRGLQAQSVISAVAGVNMVSIAPNPATLPVFGSLQLTALASAADGSPIAIDRGAVRWSTSGSGGQVNADGLFTAGPKAAKTIVNASVGGSLAHVQVLSGEHAVMVARVPQAGDADAQWRYVAAPSGLPGGVDAQAAPDGSAALRLAYDFSSSDAVTKAAYAQTKLPLRGQPIALSLQVFGDGNGAWLRGGYRNADGDQQSLTIARHVDWRGWRTIRVAIPDQAAWPITWTRLYLVERSRTAREQGSIWFRDFKVVYPGP